MKIKNPLTIVGSSENLNEVLDQQEQLINELTEALEDRDNNIWDGKGIIVEDETEKVADELHGTWVFNDVISFSQISQSASYNVLFQTKYAADPPCVTISILVEEGWITYYNGSNNGGNSFGAYVNGRWVDVVYQTIHIISYLDEVRGGEILLAWLKENATKQ